MLWSSRLIDENRHDPIDINALSDTSQIGNTVKSELDGHGIKLPEDNPLHLSACEYFVTAISKALDGLKLQNLKTDKVERTAIKKINLLKAIFQTALDNDKLSLNPATGVKIPREDKILSHEYRSLRMSLCR